MVIDNGRGLKKKTNRKIHKCAHITQVQFERFWDQVVITIYLSFYEGCEPN